MSHLRTHFLLYKMGKSCQILANTSPTKAIIQSLIYQQIFVEHLLCARHFSTLGARQRTKWIKILPSMT